MYFEHQFFLTKFHSKFHFKVHLQTRIKEFCYIIATGKKMSAEHIIERRNFKRQFDVK